MAGKNNQQTFRVTGHLQDAMPALQKKLSEDQASTLYRAALRNMFLNPMAFVHELRLSKESPDVQEIVDMMIAAQFKSGIAVDELAKPAWMTAKITEARAKVMRQTDLYWVIVGDRRLGPHRLDLIRLWVAQKVADEAWLLQPEKGTKTTPIGFLPSFWEFPDSVNDELRHIRNRIDALPDEAPTKKQLEKLNFFGLPYPADLRRPRASEILDVWMVLDPATEERWQKAK